MLVPNHEGRAEKTRGFHPSPSASATRAEGVTPKKQGRDSAQGMDGQAIKQELSSSAWGDGLIWSRAQCTFICVSTVA